VYLVNVVVTSVSFVGTISNTTSLIAIAGSSTIEIVGGVFSSITSYATTSAIFSDSGSSTPRTVVVKVNGSTFTGVVVDLI
jgi:hypothetical protein